MTKKLIAFDENVNVLLEGVVDKEYKKETVVDIEGLEGRFFVTQIYDGHVFVTRIPSNMDEKEFVIKMLSQIKKATPINKF